MVSFEIISLVAFAMVIGLWLLTDRKNKDMQKFVEYIERETTAYLNLYETLPSF